MKITASKHAKNNYTEPVVPAGQLVNRIGKYFYKHLDSAFKMDKQANMCDVYFVVIYSIPAEIVKVYELENSPYADVRELTIDMSTTTYQNKIRINLIEVTPEERTLGFDVFPPEKLQNMQEAYDLIWNKIIKRIEKAFEDFEFIF